MLTENMFKIFHREVQSLFYSCKFYSFKSNYDNLSCMAWKYYDYLQAKEEARRLNEQRTTEERIRLEKERQIQLEKERQAVLEEKRRKQAEIDRLERERQVYHANMPMYRKVPKFSDARKLCELSPDEICSLVKLTLENNHFQFNEKNYIQKHGTAMGSSMA